MRFSFCFLTLLVVLPAPVQGFDDPQQILEKAIAAHGGAEQIAKYPAITWKGKGTVHIQGMAINYSGSWAQAGLNKQRAAIEAEFNGQAFQFIVVLNGEKGWRKMGEDTNEMTEDEYKSERNSAHVGYISRLIPLKDKAYTLTALKESTVENRPVDGINVARAGYNDVKLYFDRESHMLVKCEFQSIDAQSGGEFKQENYYSNFKDVQGSKHPMKFIVKRDGTLFLENEASEVKREEKLEESLFEKP